MTGAQTQELSRQILAGDISALVPALILAAVLGFFGAFLGSYLRRRGENLATRQDIGRITREVEAVKAEYAKSSEALSYQYRLLIEQGSWRHQLRVAALPERLKTHQEAYALWRELRAGIHDDRKCTELVLRCQEWWVTHCLYLEEGARLAFYRAYVAAARHSDLVAARRETIERGEDDAEFREEVRRNRDDLDSAGDQIVKGVSLPSLGDAELYEVRG